MPIYEYQCQGCGQVFEVLQKVSDLAPSQHSCGSTQVQRILSHTSFVLKGTGWYVTDYPDASKKEAKTETKTEPTTKTEVKPEPTAKPAAAETSSTTSTSVTTQETSSGAPGSSGGGGGTAA